MRKVIYGLLLGLLSSAASAETYQCDYAKADITNGAMGNMSTPRPAKVEVTGDAIKAYRPDGSFIFSPPITQSQGALKILDDGSRVYAVANDRSNFAISDRISKVTEQWDQCKSSKISTEQVRQQDEIKEVEEISGIKAKNYFLNEKHAFTTNCLVWEDVTMITGKVPAMIIAGSVDLGRKPKWDGKTYSFTFNGGSMVARFTPSEPKHKFFIQAGDKFYGCGPSTIDHNYD